MLFNFFHFLGWILSNIIGKLFFHLEFKGQENIEKLAGGGVVFIANHHSKFDAFFIGAGIPRLYFKKIKSFRYLTYYAHVHLRLYGPFIWLTGAYAVRPAGGDYAKSLKRTVQFLNDNQSILMFPTGHREKEFNTGDARPGIAYLARTGNYQIVPVYIHDTYRISIPDLILRKRKVKVIFGKPFRYEIAKDNNDLKTEARKIMQKVESLSPQLSSESKRAAISC